MSTGFQVSVMSLNYAIFVALFLSSHVKCTQSQEYPESVTAGDLTTIPSTDPHVRYIHKCQCDVTSVHDGDICVQHELLSSALSSAQVNVTIGVVVCPPDSAAVTLPQELFTQLEDGGIYVSSAEWSLQLDEYCVEFVHDSHGKLAMEARTCLGAPNVPICCPGQRNVFAFEMSSDGRDTVSCHEEHVAEGEAGGSVMSPPVYIDDVVLPFSDMKTHLVPISCEPGYTPITLTIGKEDQAVLEFNTNGLHLKWMSHYRKLVTVSSDKFCIDQQQNATGDPKYYAHFCYLDPLTVHTEQCKGKTCVRKCCPDGTTFHSSFGCTEYPGMGDWLPQIHNSQNLLPTDRNVSFTTVFGFPICPDFFNLDSLEDPFVLTDDGQLYVLSFATSFAPSLYCIDNTIDDNGTVGNFALVCFGVPEEDSQSECKWQRVLQIIAITLSCVFIAATLFVYLSVSEICRRLASKCVVSEGLALLVSFLCLIILQTISMEQTTVFCVATGLLFYYATLASFFWLNVMCIDMYFTIKSIIPVSEIGSSGLRWFLQYSLYGWGMPLVFTVVVCICDNLPYHVNNYGIIRPKIFTTCHLTNTDARAQWIYMYGPMVVLLIINTVLFVLVAVLLVRQHKEHSRVLQGADSCALSGKGSKGNSKARDSTVLCLKLFVVMGVTWLMEIISFADGNSCYVWLAPDIINCLRGLFIFLIFVCKRDVLKKFQSAWRPRLSKLPPMCHCWSEAPRPALPCSNADHSSQLNSSFWQSRKTSTASIFSFVGGKRKASNVSNTNDTELNKMEVCREGAECNVPQQKQDKHF